MCHDKGWICLGHFNTYFHHPQYQRKLDITGNKESIGDFNIHWHYQYNIKENGKLQKHKESLWDFNNHFQAT